MQHGSRQRNSYCSASCTQGRIVSLSGLAGPAQDKLAHLVACGAKGSAKGPVQLSRWLGWAEKRDAFAAVCRVGWASAALVLSVVDGGSCHPPALIPVLRSATPPRAIAQSTVAATPRSPKRGPGAGRLASVARGGAAFF